MSLPLNTDNTHDTTDILRLSDTTLNAVQDSGADHADVMVYHTRVTSVNVLDGKAISLESNDDLSLGVRIIHDAREVCVSGNDISAEGIARLIRQAMAMAVHLPQDDKLFINTPENVFHTAAQDIRALDMFDTHGVQAAETLKEYAQNCETTGLAQPSITKSDGCSMSQGETHIAIASSNGYRTQYSRSYSSISLSLIAGQGDYMERDYAYDSTCHLADLRDGHDIAVEAATRTANRINPRKGKTGEFPVIYDRHMATSLVRHLLRGINGIAIMRGTSLFKDSLGAALFNDSVTITDDPHRIRGLRSSLSDTEGVKTAPLDIVRDGTLQHFICDGRSATQLGQPLTGHGRRGLSSPPAPATSNVTLHSGTVSEGDLIADIKDGFYITELMGSQISMTTGDYSRGASGYWIENGRIAYPVSQITLAGNLINMFKNLVPADNGQTRMTCESPSLFVSKMTLSSQ